MNYFNYVALIILAVFVFINHSVQKLLTVVHECGHIYHLMLINRESDPIYTSSQLNCKKATKPLMYKGRTDSKMYFLLKNERRYFDIRCNAIFGYLFVILPVLPILFMSVFIYLLVNVCVIRFIAFFITTLCVLTIVSEILVFFNGSDFKHFLHPERFEYNPND